MRGTANGEQVVSQANTAEFEENYERVFGANRKPQRGKWIFDEATQKFVSIDEYVPPSSDALNAPVMSGRFYENTCATDGTDISTRARHKQYLKDRGLTTIDDYKNTWDQAEKKRAQGASTPEQQKDRREAIGRELYRVNNLPQEKYDREVKERTLERRRRIEHVDGDL